MTNKNFKIGLVGFVVAMITFIGFAFTSKESSNGNQKSANIHGTDHTAFKVENTVLVLVDHQVGTIGWAGELANKDEQDQLKMWVRIMARFAKSAGIPVILTSSLESESQGPLLPEFKEILPAEYAARVQRTGVINAWDDPKFVAAIKATGKKNIIMGGLTTDVCLVPPALSAQASGYNVVALLDISAACTKIGAQNSRELLQKAGIEVMTVTPLITSMLGDYKNPASGGFFEAFEKEGVYGAFAKGNLR
jgi:nicotinamidase-related amidase